MTTKRILQELKTIRDIIYNRTDKQSNDLTNLQEHTDEQNQMLTDCILEMSEIVYGGDSE